MMLYRICVCSISKQLLKHLQRLQLWQFGHVYAVIAYYGVHHPVAVKVRHAVKVHRGIVHAQQQSYLARLVRTEHVGVHRPLTAEAAAPHVEPVARLVVVGIGIKIREISTGAS